MKKIVWLCFITCMVVFLAVVGVGCKKSGGGGGGGNQEGCKVVLSDTDNCGTVKECCTDTECWLESSEGEDWGCDGKDCHDRIEEVNDYCQGDGGGEVCEGISSSDYCGELFACCNANLNECWYESSQGDIWDCNGTDCEGAANEMVNDCFAY